MQTYDVMLTHEPWASFRCQKAANSLDIDVAKKLTHHLHVDADVETDFAVGVIVGASGSGKTTLAEHIWGAERMKRALDPATPVIEQFPESMEYADCVRMLNGVGLSSVPCWIRPAFTLSNGQRERAEIALRMARADDGLCVIDEWTSVVDRTVAKVMSHAIQKWARASKRRVVLVTCHYDVLDWLQPDWIIDCNSQTYTDRRLLRQDRREHLTFEIRECDRSAWKHFAKYHYLSERLPGGIITTYGLYLDDVQIGFQCFAGYTPYRKEERARGDAMKMHSNRTVIHPDYVGLGLGMMLINETSQLMTDRGFDVYAKFSSAPVYRAMMRDGRWRLLNVSRAHKVIHGSKITRDGGYRLDVTTYSFHFSPDGKHS